MKAEGRPATTQARGRKRRDALLAAARALLAERESDKITLVDVAERAGIPKSSAYHFYADILELYNELVAILDTELQAVIAQPITPVTGWEQVVGEVIDRAAAYFEAHPAAQQLMLSSQTPPAVKRSSRRADIETSHLIEQHIDTHFVMPDIPDRSRIFFHAVEAADLMFGLSLFQHGMLLDSMVEEAKKMACAYLGLYLPRFLRRRDDTPAAGVVVPAA
ncbi:TetR family transcriptional regulator [Govanella unica]|uniref:TetR family transcriptional regulator n=1 Tax=Govanella unica TaxID=2975056 RepID=A0A9X3Z682_9PROT|nr:TetR family transcriptional regulator [Govania unica]MDA5192930.1 TetR family transcriptional regulator [Govania unica]